MTIEEIVRLQALHEDWIYLLSQGAFYHAYNDGAEHLHAIAGYRVRDVDGMKMAGFPISALGCVTNKVVEYHNGSSVVVSRIGAHVVMEIESML